MSAGQCLTFVARCCPAADLVTWPWADGVACDIFCCGEGFSAGGRRKAEGRGKDDDVAINRMGPDSVGGGLCVASTVGGKMYLYYVDSQWE